MFIVQMTGTTNEATIMASITDSGSNTQSELPNARQIITICKSNYEGPPAIKKRQGMQKIILIGI